MLKRFRLFSLVREMTCEEDTPIDKYIKLENDINLLKDSMETIYDLINNQQESIDTLDDFIQISKYDIQGGRARIEDGNQYAESKNQVLYTGGIISGVITVICVGIHFLLLG